MSEVEKMYENANAYKNLCKCSFKNLYDYSIDYGQDVCIYAEDEIRHGCEGCELAEQNVKYYPPFTAEKQLELIKWLAKTRPIHITFLIDKWVIEGMVRYGKRYDTFEDALSGYINNIWQDLTELEQEQIRSILK